MRTLDELEALGRIRFPADGSFRSARFLTAADGTGFSYNENRVKEGTDLVVWLKHHWEANYIVSGKGEVTDLTRNQRWPLEAGVLYVVGPNDRHRLHLTEDECHLSIFYPPLRGDECFDEDGSYEASGPIAKTDRRMFVKRVDDMRRAGKEGMTAKGQIRTVPMLTAADDVGFGLFDVRVERGAETDLRNEHQRQAHHIISGVGEVTDMASGRSWEFGPSMVCTVGPNEQCRLRAHSDIHLISILSSPINGDETAAVSGDA